MATEQSQRVVITLPRDMYEAIKALADKNRRSMAEEVRIAIEQRLKKIEAGQEESPKRSEVAAA